MADLEDALKKLDRLTQEEARMALAEMLSITHHVRDEVKIVDGKVERVENKVEVVGRKVGDKVDGVGDKVGEVGDKVGDVCDKVQRVDDKVQVVIDGTRACPISCQSHSNIYTRRWQASESSGTGNQIGCSTRGQRY